MHRFVEALKREALKRYVLAVASRITLQRFNPSTLLEMNFKQQLLRYWLAMNASAFDAAIHSCAAFFGVAGAHAAVESIPALNLQQLAAVFLISFGRGLLNYLDTHPIEALLPQLPVEGNQPSGTDRPDTSDKPAAPGPLANHASAPVKSSGAPANS